MVAVHRPSTKCKLHDPPFCIFQTSWLLSNSVRGEGSHPSTALRKPDVEPESDLRVIRAPPVSLVRVTQVAGLASPTPSTLEFSFSTVPAILSGLAAQPSNLNPHCDRKTSWPSRQVGRDASRLDAVSLRVLARDSWANVIAEL